MNHSPIAGWADKAPWRWAAVSIVLGASVLFAYYLTGKSDEARAVKDARIAAEQREQQTALFRKALQDQCGGPEASVVDAPRGGWDCFDTNGRKTKTIPGLARPVSQGPQHAARVFGARLQQTKHECANSCSETESAGMVPAGFLKG